MRNQRTDPHPHINFYVRSIKASHRMTPGMLFGSLLQAGRYFFKAVGLRLKAIGSKLKAVLFISHSEMASHIMKRDK